MTALVPHALPTDRLARLAALLGVSQGTVLIGIRHLLAWRRHGAAPVLTLTITGEHSQGGGPEKDLPKSPAGGAAFSTQSGISAVRLAADTSFAMLATAVQRDLQAIPMRRDLLGGVLFGTHAKQSQGSPQQLPHTTPAETKPAIGPDAIGLDAMPDNHPAIMLDMACAAEPEGFSVRERAGALALLARPGSNWPRWIDSVTEGVLQQPQGTVSALPLPLPPADLERIRAWNAISRPVPATQTIERLVAAHAQQAPTAIAVEDALYRVTYKQIDSEAERLSVLIRQHGAANGAMEQDSVAGVALPSDWRLPTTVLAAMKAGLAPLLLDMGARKEHILALMAESRATVLLTSRAAAPLMPAGPWMVLALEDLADPAPAVKTAPRPPRIAAMVASDAGEPRLASLRHDSFVNLVAMLRETLPITPADRMLSLSPPDLPRLLLPLACGAALVLLSDAQMADPPGLLARLQSARATLCHATPSVWRLVLRAGWRGQDKPRILCSGEPLDTVLAATLAARSNGLWSLFESAETAVWSMLEQVRDTARPDAAGNTAGNTDSAVAGIAGPAELSLFVPIGRPLANARAYVLDGPDRLAPPGFLGGLWIGGIGVDPNTGGARLDPFLRDGGVICQTGDRARLLPDGRIAWLGRTDDPALQAGLGATLDAVEAAFARHPAVDQAGCRVIEHGGRPGLAVWLLPRTGVAFPDAAALVAHLARILPQAARPARLAVVAGLQRSPAGRLDRAALPMEAPPLRDTTLRSVHAETETQLIRLWKQALDSTSAERNDHVFARGAAAGRVLTLLDTVQRQYGVALTLDTLAYLAPTPAQLALLIAEPARADPGGMLPLQPEPAKGQKEPRHVPLFCTPLLGVGGLLPYRRLAAHLDGVIPVLGLLPPGHAPHDPPPPSLDASLDTLVEHGAALIRRRQQQGPYFLCGLGSGGVLAFGIAQALHAAGEQIGALLLIDTLLPRKRDRLLARLGLPGAAEANGLDLDEARLDPYHRRMARHLRLLAHGFRPQTARFPVLLYATTQSVHTTRDTSLGWRRYAPRLELVELPGNHGDVGREPLALRIAQHIMDVFDTKPAP